MAIVSIPADLSKGADPSPWTLNGDDLYTDSTSYLVGIGLTDPEAYLHSKAINNTTALKLEQVGSGTTYKFAEFKNEAATTETFAPYIYSDAINGFTRVRFAGSGYSWMFDTLLSCRGGIDLNGTSGNLQTTGTVFRVQASNGFSMGSSAFTPNNARLHIKEASKPQLKLDDGTNNTTFEQSGDELTIDVDAGKLKLDSGLSFASVSKTADYTMLASDHVVFCNCPAGTPGMTITLPANSAGRMVKIIDNAGSCSNVSGSEKHIRVTPASGTINGTTHVDIENAYGSVFAICDGTNWTITN